MGVAEQQRDSVAHDQDGERDSDGRRLEPGRQQRHVEEWESDSYPEGDTTDGSEYGMTDTRNRLVDPSDQFGDG